MLMKGPKNIPMPVIALINPEALALLEHGTNSICQAWYAGAAMLPKATSPAVTRINSKRELV